MCVVLGEVGYEIIAGLNPGQSVEFQRHPSMVSLVCLPPFGLSRVSPHLGKSLPSQSSYLRPFQEGFCLSLILTISLLKLNMCTVPNILCDFLISKFRSHNCEIVLFWLNHLPRAETSLLAHDFQTEIVYR